MGLSDCDYMHERQSEIFGKKKSSWSNPFRTTQGMILTWAAILFLLYQSFLWWESQKHTAQKLRPDVEVRAQHSAPIPRVVPSTRNRNQADSAADMEPSNTTTGVVTKCLLNGQVIFTDRKCPSGASASRVAVNASNFGTVTAPLAIPASPQVQQEIVVQQPVAETQHVASTHSLECNVLKQQIDQIDAMARQPLSTQSQDNLSAQRKTIRSRQYSLRC